MNTLSILNGHGDTRLTWNPDDPAECEDVRRTVADLKSHGYNFYLTSGAPIDEVTAGAGELVVRRLEAEEVAPQPGPAPEADPSPLVPRRRGRPPRAAATNVVAVRPVVGG